MATNFVQEGDVITYSNSGSAIAAGDVVEVGNQIGVALVDIAATTGTGAVAMQGVFDLPKVTAAVIAEGEAVIWDTSAGKFDDASATPATGDISVCCIAWEGLGAVAGNIKVNINVGVGTVT